MPVPGTISYPLHTYILFTLANTQVGTYTCIDKACCCWKNMLGTIIFLIIILAIIRSPAHMLWLIHAEPTPDPLKSVASQTGADVQKPAPLAIVALDLCCIYTHEQPFQFEEWVSIGLSWISSGIQSMEGQSCISMTAMHKYCSWGIHYSYCIYLACPYFRCDFSTLEGTKIWFHTWERAKKVREKALLFMKLSLKR